MKAKTIRRRKLNGCARLERMDKAGDKLVKLWAALGVRL